jgi:hypothetical protein
MARLKLDLNTKIKQFTCLHCGEQSLTVWGYISKDNLAYAVYYANLMTGHKEVSARLTISLGGWGEGADETKRRWVYIEARPTSDSYEMMLRVPEESLYHGEALLGTPIAREEALTSVLRDEIFEIADYIAFNDPAVRSYLCGENIDRSGRAEPVP